MLQPDYHTEALNAYRAYNDSPIQGRLRDESPVLVGAVYWNPQQDSEANLRYELRRMRETGFTFVRFHDNPAQRADGSIDFSAIDLRYDLAHEAGLLVYPHVGLHAPTSASLVLAGIDREESRRWDSDDPRILAAMRPYVEAVVGHYRDHPAVAAWLLGGEPNATGIPLRDEADCQRFRDWLQQQYDSPRAVHDAWLIYPDERRDLLDEPGYQKKSLDSWDDAVAMAKAIAPRQPGATLAATGIQRHELFGANRDLVRFRVDSTIRYQRAVVAMIKAVDPERPTCYGTHQLFYNNGELAWDQFRTGRVADMHFTSIHLSWHFEPVHGEFDRPHYLQARLTSDVFKGGYTNCYETTGGPVQYSGGYGNHMDAPMMRKLMLNFLAAGNEGSAFWDWIPRPGGVEAGEYGLVSQSGRITEWADEAGRVARAMERHRQEIWHWAIDPELAILRSWDTETVMTCEPRRHDCQDGPSPWSRGPAQQHVRAWIGAGRVAIDHQVDFQYLSTEEILDGLAGVYPAIMLPHVRCLSDAVLAKLEEYVRAGGRLIADVQVGFEDEYGKLRWHGEGRAIERLFGAWVDTIHDAHSRPQSVDGVDCPGFFGELVCTRAEVIRRFDTGKPAVVEHRLGDGTATLIGFDIARSCWQPGNDALAAILADCYRGPVPPRWRCGVPMTYRRSHPDADHFFIVNDGPARSTVLRVYDRSYSSIENVLDGGGLPADGTIPIAVPGWSALWLRCQRS